jgi:hypothetical protein
MNVLAAAERRGFRRVVVFSSMLALGNPPPDGVVDDRAKANPSELAYARAKQEMERRCRAFAAGSKLEVVLLRPTCVFGPFGRDFGSAPLAAQASGNFFLLDGGKGLANLVYVDNLVDAALLAARAPCPSGSAFIINEEEWPASWAEFLTPQMQAAFGDDVRVIDVPTESLRRIGAGHAREHSFPMVFRQAIRSHAASAAWVSGHPLFRAWKSLQSRLRGRSALASPIANPAVPEVADRAASARAELEARLSRLPKFPYGDFYLRFFGTKASFRSDAARTQLGWMPRVDRGTAMAETLAWVERAYPRKSTHVNCDGGGTACP